MQLASQEIEQLFGGQVRLRACGICIHQGEILLVNHALYGPDHDFWAPPGGGIQYGESVTNGLKREFLEETGLDVEVKDFLFVSEHLVPPLHAVELFFRVEIIGGNLVTGIDPELAENRQIISNVRFMSPESLAALPADRMHSVLSGIGSFENIEKMGPFVTGSRQVGSD